MKKKLFEYGIDYLYLIGGIVILAFGIYVAYFGVGMDSDDDALIEKILLSLSLIVSAFLYLRYAFHLNYQNSYIRFSLFFILCSIFPYIKFMDIPFNGDMETYLLEIASMFGTFIFLIVAGLTTLFVGYMKGRTNLENVKAYPIKN